MAIIGTSDAMSLRTMLHDCWKSELRMNFPTYMKNMILVTDSMSVTPNIVGATISPSVELTEK